jgi:hypothetical protein
MATKLKITYEDGTEVEVIATPRAQVETERALSGLGESNQIQATYRLAFESVKARRLIDSGLGYEEWLDTILDVDEVKKEGDEGERPTPEAPSMTSSSDSASAPDSLSLP